MPPTPGRPVASEASLLSELDRSELGRLWAVTLRAAYLRALDESRAQAARRMLDDDELRAIHAEFRRRDFALVEERCRWGELELVLPLDPDREHAD